ncbi:Uu.00g136200.m01.CDS01 [Anthostomella pinea]|uniref:Uu.00g136200.m01.CDS01 n=1 Tax=Anthostomella pinea TaxID=933095 RepID=A0AAI8VPC3_9PEZI|nr:Uu.00g136200.m01.CDS01 [Anthostomella pinea]
MSSNLCTIYVVFMLADKAKLMAVQKHDPLTVFVFEFQHDAYDLLSAHKRVDLPVILLDYGSTTSVKLSVGKLRDQVNSNSLPTCTSSRDQHAPLT